MLKSPGIHRGLSSLIAFVLVAAAYRPVLAQSPGCAVGFDGDNDVDLLDYAEFSVCFSGAGGESGADCTCFDLDDDDDIDLADFTLFSQVFTGPLDCAAEQADCGGGCIDVWWDENNCGTCGNQCAPQDRCEYGSCAPCGEPGPCFGGFLYCGGACRNVGLDPSNCGCCGIICGPGYCSGGLCWDAEEPCPGVDLWWDSANCGTCGNVCPEQTACAWGTCEGICYDCGTLAGQAGADPIPGDFDDDGDVDLADFVEFQMCALGPAISQTDSVCIDARLDADADVDLDDFAVFHRCFSGEDNPADPNCACPPGLTICDGTCLDMASDEANCGACDNACATGLVCQNGSCAACGEGTADCGGACIDIWWDGWNCGACGNICQPVDHCSWGQCEGSCIDCE